MLITFRLVAPFCLQCGTEECWNCYQHHYENIDWNDLPAAARTNLESLGWSSNSWTLSELESVAGPASEDKLWAELADSEQSAARNLCYEEKTWNMGGAPDDSNGGICFSGQSTVQVRGRKAPVPMESLQIGDYVRGLDGTYSMVYSFGHIDRTSMNEYLQIRVDSAGGAKKTAPLEISADHMVYVENQSKMLPAKDIQVGDVLMGGNGGPAQKVVKIHRVVRQGAYGPWTTSGNLLVSGVAVSNYITLDVVGTVFSPKVQHAVYHAAVSPYRAYCSAIGCRGETYNEDGFPKFVVLILPLIGWFDWMIQNWAQIVLMGATAGYYFFVWKKQSSPQRAHGEMPKKKIV